MLTIRQILAVGMLLLLAGSHRLWTPQTLFPCVPLIESLNGLSPEVDSAITWCTAGIMVLCCVSLALPRATPSQRPTSGPLAQVTESQATDSQDTDSQDTDSQKTHSSSHLVWSTLASSQLAIALLVAALLVQISLDQHRLQPWAVHIALCLILLDTQRESKSLTPLFWLTASIYVYSALSKLDAQFLHTVGQDFLQALGRMLQFDISRMSEAWRVGLTLLFPLGELACGVGLIFSSTRRLCALLAVLMHATLIAILGPWGLNHSWGVLLWNALFIALNLRMLSCRPVDERLDFRSLIGRVVLSVAVLVPLGERWGWTDHWLGWALYAPHSSRAIVRVPEQAVERLPASLQPLVSSPEAEQFGWCQLHLDNWSLATLGVPIYPQDRFYVAVAEAATRDLDEFEVQTTLLGVADRWTGRRTERTLSRRSELVEQTQRYWINAVARP